MISGNHQATPNQSQLTIGKSGSNKTGPLNFVKEAVAAFEWCLRTQYLDKAMHNFDLASLKSIVVDGGTLNAIKDELSNKTGEGNPSKLDGNQYTAGSGVYLHTEIFQTLQSMTVQAKGGTNMDWLCSVRLIVFVFYLFFFYICFLFVFFYICFLFVFLFVF